MTLASVDRSLKSTEQYSETKPRIYIRVQPMLKIALQIRGKRILFLMVLGQLINCLEKV